MGLLQIEDARVIMDRENPFRSRGFGFITFSRPEDAQSAIKMNHDKEWQGRNMRVNLASQPPQRPSQ
jgi:RNA recognition motif-containing protein